MHRWFSSSRAKPLINFMYDFINRFLGFQDASNEESLDRCFGTPSWRAIRDRPDRESALVDLYMEQVRATGAFPYVTFTRILKPLHDRAYFHLIYATRSPTGIEKFREVERKVVAEQETVRERAQREHRESRSGQTEFEFALEAPSNTLQEERDLQRVKAEAKVLKLLEKGPMRYEMLEPLVLELRLVWRTDLNEILVEGRRSGRVIIDGLRPRERTPKRGCTIRLAGNKS